MENFAKRFSDLVVRRGGPEEAEGIGVSINTVYSWMAGKMQPTLKNMRAIRKWAGPDAPWLFGEQPPGIPVTCIVSADAEQILGPSVIWNEGETLGSVELPREAYAALVRGNSMEPIVRSGQKLILTKEPAGDGDLAIARLANGAALFKRLRDCGKEWELQSVAAECKPQRVKKSDVLETRRVVGVCFF